MPQEIPKDRRNADSDLNDIQALRRNIPFTRYWMKEPKRRIEELERELTSCQPVEMGMRNQKLGELKVWRRILGKLDEDEAANRSILGLGSSEEYKEESPSE